jgi:protein TonB
MLAYAAHRRTVAGRRPAPHALLVIVVAHIALIAAVMSARTDLPKRIFDPPIVVTPIPIDPLPLPEPQPKADPPTAPTVIDRVPPPIPLPRLNDRPIVDSAPVPGNPGVIDGPVVIPQPRLDPLPLPLPKPQTERVGPRFDTAASAIRPPYPASRIASGEEALLRLRLAIDERGRVVAVEPIGKADPAFLASARRHLLARWRYKPATENGRAIASSTVITLRFQLDD